MKYRRKVMREGFDYRTLCDYCGLDLSARGDWYRRDEVTIEARLGEVYDEGDHRTVYEIDCCAACFIAKVKPAVEALGVKFREHGADESDAVDEGAGA